MSKGPGRVHLMLVAENLKCIFKINLFILIGGHTLQYCSGFCHTLTWISHGYTCVPHPEATSHLPPHPISLGHLSAPALSTLSHASNLDWRSIREGSLYWWRPERDKGLSSQRCRFSSSHVQMWELDHKESWVPKNWCFWTVVMEREDSCESLGLQGDQTGQS